MAYTISNIVKKVIQYDKQTSWQVDVTFDDGAKMTVALPAAPQEQLKEAIIRRIDPIDKRRLPSDITISKDTVTLEPDDIFKAKTEETL